MKKVGIYYGSSSGNTERIAKSIQSLLQGFEIGLFDVSNVKSEDFDNFDNLILGTSTWGIGDLQDDWESFLPKLEQISLDGKVIALFGLGDSYTYSDSFVDGMGTIYGVLKNKNCKIVGNVKTDTYSFDESKAVVDNDFVGLPIDEDNQANLTSSRLEEWVNQIKNAFI
jgi:flavodoxin I